MDRRSRICAAGGVFLAGLAVALPFREEQPSVPSAVPPTGALAVPQSPIPPLAATNPGAPIAPPTSNSVVGEQAQLPRTTSEGPGPAGPTAAGPAIGPRRCGPPRRHKVIDGDTLAALAQRYLGSADFAAEIFALNRDVLSSPELLPIGIELAIPGENAIPTPGGGRPLVPVR